MNRNALVAAALAATAFVPATADAGPPGPAASRCTWIHGPQTWWTTYGVFSAGPITIAEGTDPRSGRVTCTLVDGFRHDSPVITSVTGPTSQGVVHLPPTVHEYWADPDALVTVCVSVEIDGEGTYYYDGDAHAWTTDSSAGCPIAL